VQKSHHHDGFFYPETCGFDDNLGMNVMSSGLMKLYTAFYHALSTVNITALLVLLIAMLFFSRLANSSADNICF